MPPLPSRLMGSDEAPSWITEASWHSKNIHGAVSNSAKDITIEDLSQGRKRKDVVYDDGLTDDQYCRGLEHLADSEEVKRKKARIEELASRAEKRLLQPVVVKPVKQRLSEDVAKSLEKLIVDLGKLLKEDGTLASFYFKKLPDRAHYPDYYHFISHPICIKDISSKLKKQGYNSVEAFEADFALLCKNARTYNQEGKFRRSVVICEASRIHPIPPRPTPVLCLRRLACLPRQ